MEKQKGTWLQRILFLIALAILSMIIASFFSTFTGFTPIISGNVALIPIKGTISTEGTRDFFSPDVASSSTIIEFIERAEKNPNIEAIIFEINSPGGSAVASDEIASAVKKVSKPTVALIREVGASGAYWVASATDHIIANRMSVTGSIGVIASYLEFSRLLENYNVTYQRLVSGEYKDLGSPFKELTDEERNLFQEQLDLIHDFFIQEVAQNRNLSYGEIENIATGMFYLGVKAKDLDLVDELGGKDEAIAFIENKLNITAQIAEYKEKRTFYDILRYVFNENSFFIGKGFGSAFLDKSREVPRISIRT